MSFKLLTTDAFKNYIDNLKITRSIKLIQLHHTYSPNYSHFNGSNHIKLQENMKNYHVNTNGWSDIAQQFTIFPDGKICTGRDINTAPAGIKGANTYGICIECLGNFDKGGDIMTSSQLDSIVRVVKILLDRFNLSPENGVTYHAWWTSDGKSLGTYVKGKSAKTCPGTNFFGGNTREAYESNLMPLLKKNTVSDTTKNIEDIDTIINILSNSNVLIDKDLWTQKCRDDRDVYWLCYKMANKLEELGLTSLEYRVRVTDDSLNYRRGPGVSYDILGSIEDRGVYTIIEEKDGWGKLKSKVGWINLNYTERV